MNLRDGTSAADRLQAAIGLGDPRSVKFWGVLLPAGGDDYSKFPRLIGAIYDFLKNTTEEPLRPSVSTGTMSFLTPHMMAAAFELFDWDHLRFTEDEQKRVDAHILDSLLMAYYKLHNLVFSTVTRPGGPIGGLPLLPRFVFRNFIAINIQGDPSTMRHKINAILAKKGLKVLLDPYTETLFQYTDIPLSAFPAEPDAQAKTVIDVCTKQWRKMKSSTLQESITNQQSFSSSAAERLAQPVFSTPTQPPPQSQSPSHSPPPSQPQPPRRSEAQILAQLQVFRPLPNESDTASRARFDAIVEGVDDTTLERLLEHAHLQESVTGLNAANAMLASTEMVVQAVEDGFRSQNAALGMRDSWIERKWVWR